MTLIELSNITCIGNLIVRGYKGIAPIELYNTTQHGHILSFLNHLLEVFGDEEIKYIMCRNNFLIVQLQIQMAESI